MGKRLQCTRRNRHTINSIFHISYSRSHYRNTRATVCVCIVYAAAVFEWVNVLACVCVFESDKLKIINNHVNEQEKEGEHIEWQAERIILCLLYFNSEKRTQYYDICGLNVAVGVVCCCFLLERTIQPFLLLSLCVCCSYFCCFSFCRWTTQQMTTTATAPRETGWMFRLFRMISCVHYHIFRFSSWWIFDACRHCAVSAAVRIF